MIFLVFTHWYLSLSIHLQHILPPLSVAKCSKPKLIVTGLSPLFFDEVSIFITEPPASVNRISISPNGNYKSLISRTRIRTSDLRVIGQKPKTPVRLWKKHDIRRFQWWGQDSNLGPSGYEPDNKSANITQILTH